MEKFLNQMVEILDTETEISLDSHLETIEEWDSLSVVSFLSMVDIEYSKQIKAADVKNAQTMRDLYNLILKEK
jgi:acyl carrier protein